MIEQEFEYVVVQFDPFNGLYGKAQPKRGTHQASGIYSLVEVFERVGKSVIRSL